MADVAVRSENIPHFNKVYLLALHSKVYGAFASGTVSQKDFDLAIRSGEALKQMLNTATMAGFDAIYARLRKIGLRRWEEL